MPSLAVHGLATTALLVVSADAHGHLTFPASRNGGTLQKAADCMHGECIMWFSCVSRAAPD